MRCTSSSRGLNATKHPFFPHENSLLNYFVHSTRNMDFWPTTPFKFLKLEEFVYYILSTYRGIGYDFWPQRLKFKTAEMKTRSSTQSNIFRVYTRSPQDILMSIFCTSLGQCKVNVYSICWTALRRKLLYSFSIFIARSHNDSLCNQLYWRKKCTEVESFEIFRRKISQIGHICQPCR